MLFHSDPFLDKISRAICRDMLSFPLPPKLDRAGFVAKYLPQYAERYALPAGLRLRPDGRATNPTRGTWQAQETKRQNRIDAAFVLYTRLWDAQDAADRRASAALAASETLNPVNP